MDNQARLQSQAALWLSYLSGVDVPESAGFDECLQDGIIICKSLNAMVSDIVCNIQYSTLAFKKMENISKALKAMREIGLRDFELFDTNDLYMFKGMDKVVNTIHALGSHRHAPAGFCGPFLVNGNLVDADSSDDDITYTDNSMSSSILDEAWETGYSESGDMYYYNRETGESRWDAPQHLSQETSFTSYDGSSLLETLDEGVALAPQRDVSTDENDYSANQAAEPLSRESSFSSTLRKISFPRRSSSRSGSKTHRQGGRLLRKASALGAVLNSFISSHVNSRHNSTTSQGSFMSRFSSHSRAASVESITAFKAVVLGDWEPREENEIRVKEGQHVTVLDCSDSGWWEAVTEDGAKGYLPATYLEAKDGPEDSVENFKNTVPKEVLRNACVQSPTTMLSDCDSPSADKEEHQHSLIGNIMSSFWHSRTPKKRRSLPSHVPDLAAEESLPDKYTASQEELDNMSMQVYFYLDDTRQRHGPFDAPSMREWCNAQYFDETTYIGLSAEGKFFTIEEVFPNFQEEAFLTKPIWPHISEEQVSSLQNNMSHNNCDVYAEGHKDEWYFLDIHNEEQGVFSSADMRTWLEEGYFTGATPVRSIHFKQHVRIDEMFPDLSNAFPYDDGGFVGGKQYFSGVGDMQHQTQVNRMTSGSNGDVWFYLSDNGEEFGPFSQEDMIEWCKGGYFCEATPVRHVEHLQFLRIDELFGTLENAFATNGETVTASAEFFEGDGRFLFHKILPPPPPFQCYLKHYRSTAYKEKRARHAYKQSVRMRRPSDPENGTIFSRLHPGKSSAEQQEMQDLYDSTVVQGNNLPRRQARAPSKNSNERKASQSDRPQRSAPLPPQRSAPPPPTRSTCISPCNDGNLTMQESTLKTRGPPPPLPSRTLEDNHQMHKMDTSSVQNSKRRGAPPPLPSRAKAQNQNQHYAMPSHGYQRFGYDDTSLVKKRGPPPPLPNRVPAQNTSEQSRNVYSKPLPSRPEKKSAVSTADAAAGGFALSSTKPLPTLPKRACERDVGGKGAQRPLPTLPKRQNAGENFGGAASRGNKSRALPSRPTKTDILKGKQPQAHERPIPPVPTQSSSKLLLSATGKTLAPNARKLPPPPARQKPLPQLPQPSVPSVAKYKAAERTTTEMKAGGNDGIGIAPLVQQPDKEDAGMVLAAWPEAYY